MIEAAWASPPLGSATNGILPLVPGQDACATPATTTGNSISRYPRPPTTERIPSDAGGPKRGSERRKDTVDAKHRPMQSVRSFIRGLASAKRASASSEAPCRERVSPMSQEKSPRTHGQGRPCYVRKNPKIDGRWDLPKTATIRSGALKRETHHRARAASSPEQAAAFLLVHFPGRSGIGRWTKRAGGALARWAAFHS